MPKLCCVLFILFASPTRAEDVITPEQAAEGWIALFDGETLYGWKPTSDANWRVEKGTILVDDGKEGWLMTTTEFADYELHVEFKAPPSTNSGIFLRTPLEPKDPTKDCYEVNIAPKNNPFPTGSLVGRLKVGMRGGMYSFSTGGEKPLIQRGGGPVQIERDPWNGDWHSFDLKAAGPLVKISLDGTRLDTLQYRFGVPNVPKHGHIGLQFKEGPVAFRNIRLKPLSLEPLFKGKDLTGWNTDRANKSVFSVTAEREIAVKNGPGQLETNDQFGDFIMQLDCKVNGDALNSGIFFRCIPGDNLMGYESQIQNGMVDGDPTKPQDAGTGAIYRRTTARRIVARDYEWFTKTIIADGPHIAVWVDGIQITDWTDDRPEDENPRKGLRTKAGTIAIQGHDPTTDLLFKNLRIEELPSRE